MSKHNRCDVSVVKEQGEQPQELKFDVVAVQKQIYGLVH